MGAIGAFVKANLDGRALKRAEPLQAGVCFITKSKWNAYMLFQHARQIVC
jgi:hypothetical protein